MCTILCVTVSNNPINGSVLVTERVDPNVDHGFTRFRGPFIPPGGLPLPAGFHANVFGISEAWLRNPAGPEVYLAQTHSAQRPSFGDFKGSAWGIRAQDARGMWSPVFAMGSANKGNEEDDPTAAGLTVPQLMPVGRSNPQMFACAGGRSEDDAVRTTWLIEAKAPNAALGTPGVVRFIQDVLNGDDRFEPDALRPSPPTPTIKGPGNPIRDGSVQCAMTQLEDDLATRELHLLAIHSGRLYHSMASNFGPDTTYGSNRFNAVSPWGDVGQALGGGFGNIVSAALVASRPTAISVFFVAESGGRYRLWHAVRFSAGGTWRPADDVLALSGDAPGGSVYPWRVAAGVCPAFGATDWNAQNTELLVALWGGPNSSEVVVIRVVPTPRQWTASVNGIYSPLRSLGTLLQADPSRNPTVQNVVVVARPFRDGPLPSPSP
jgi:hypothetical protein